jgi:hypothetical protein
MKYYIRKSKGSELEGPFGVAQLNDRIAAGIVNSKWIATSDIGESRERVIRTPKSDWLPIADVQGVVGVQRTDSNSEEASELETATHRDDMHSPEISKKNRNLVSLGGRLVLGGIVVLLAASRYDKFYEQLHEQGSAPSWASALAWLMITGGCFLLLRGLARRD